MLRSLRWRLFLWFGALGVLGVSAISYGTFRYASGRFERQLGYQLQAVASSVAALLDPDGLAAAAAHEDPVLVETRRRLQIFSEYFDLSWIGLYRYNGRFLIHLADGADSGEQFCYGYPILDVPADVPRAWNKGECVFVPRYQDAYGTWISIFLPIKNASGTVVAVLDVSRRADEVLDLRKGILVQTAGMAALIAVLTLATCFLVARFTTRPLELVSQTVREITAGNLHLRIPPVSGSREIEMFVESFNGMLMALERSQADLHRRVSELKALNEISTKINYASSTTEILRVILEKSVVGLQATQGSIMLLDEEKQTLVVQVVWPEDAEEQLRTTHELRPGEGLVGRAFLDRQPLMFNRGSEGCLKPYEQALPASIQNLLCVPLVSDQRAIGVVSIINRTSGPFGEDDMALASTMAAQVALALEKARLYELAITDGLTKLYVHRFFQLSLDNELRRCRRYNSQFVLILFDIDHFKKFNDTYGHQTGDLVLAHTARILKGALRSVDLAARYGGEEFAVILPESNVTSGLAVAERIRKAVEAYDFPGQNQALKVTISLGIAGYPTHAEEKMDLIRKADVALYQSKKRGRNTATIFDPAFGTTSPVKS